VHQKLFIDFLYALAYIVVVIVFKQLGVDQNRMEQAHRIERHDMIDTLTPPQTANLFPRHTTRNDGESSILTHNDPDLPTVDEAKKLLSKIEDELLVSFAREALPELVEALSENCLPKIHEIIGDWFATFEECAAPSSVNKILQAAKNIEEGKGISWEEMEKPVQTRRKSYVILHWGR
jgi:hypothetical protein